MAKISINISVDWEGHYLHNLQDFINLRNEYFRDIPLTHFVCPNYFLSKKKYKYLDKIILPHDEIALHLHSWKPLVQAAGVEFKTENNYYNSYLNSFPKFLKNILINGRGVPISVYNKDELYKLIQFSKKLLEDTFSTKVFGFRAGGWIANKAVFEVLNELDFMYDSTAVAPEILSQDFSAAQVGTMLDSYGDENGVFTKQILDLWGNTINERGFLENSYRNKYYQGAISIHTQPFKIGNLWELPNNGGMSDFASTEKIFTPQIAHAQDIETDSYISFGCHQEGEIENKYAVLDNLQFVTKNNIDVDYVTNIEFLKSRG